MQRDAVSCDVGFQVEKRKIIYEYFSFKRAESLKCQVSKGLRPVLLAQDNGSKNFSICKCA